jgi:hypothetical protein
MGSEFYACVIAGSSAMTTQAATLQESAITAAAINGSLWGSKNIPPEMIDSDIASNCFRSNAKSFGYTTESEISEFVQIERQEVRRLMPVVSGASVSQYSANQDTQEAPNANTTPVVTAYVAPTPLTAAEKARREADVKAEQTHKHYEFKNGE